MKCIDLEEQGDLWIASNGTPFWSGITTINMGSQNAGGDLQKGDNHLITGVLFK
jgi:hypothetical protein